jgi:hypothetical protein
MIFRMEHSPVVDGQPGGAARTSSAGPHERMMSTESAKPSCVAANAASARVIADAAGQSGSAGASGREESVRNIGATPMHWVADEGDQHEKSNR